MSRRYIRTGLPPRCYGCEGRGSWAGNLQRLGRAHQRGKGVNAHNAPQNRSNEIGQAIRAMNFTSEDMAANHIADLYVKQGAELGVALAKGRELAQQALK